MKLALCLTPVLVLLAGCSQDAGVSKIGASQPAAPNLVGVYKGEIEIPKEKENDPAAAMAKGFGQMLGAMLELEIKEGDRFKMSVMGMPVEGKVTLAGNNITLTPETFMGMTEAEFRKEAEKAGQKPDFDSEPMKGVIEENGQVIRITGEKPGEEAMVFRRKKEETRAPVEEKVASGDKQWVGQWKARLEKPAKMTPEEEQGAKAAESMVADTRLELLADYTFKMKFVFDLEGAWSVEGQTIVLKPTKMMGMDTGESGNADPMILSIKGSELRLEEDGPGKGAMVFTRA